MALSSTRCCTCPAERLRPAGPNGNAYKFFSLPGPFLTQLPVAHTAAQTIFEETADIWYDRQEETRGCLRRGEVAAGLVYGSGADMPVKVPPAPVLPECNPGIWTKLIGSWSRRNDTFDFARLFGPQFAGLNFNENYRQTTLGTISGIDFGMTELTSPADSLVFSIMGGYLNSFVDFLAPNTLLPPDTFTSFRFSGGTAGASATYMNAGLLCGCPAQGRFPQPRHRRHSGIVLRSQPPNPSVLAEREIRDLGRGRQRRVPVRERPLFL